MPLGDSIPQFDRIVNAIRNGTCIPFLGAGVSTGYRDWRNGQAEILGCPSGSELRNELEQALKQRHPPVRELDRLTLSDLPALAEFFNYCDGGHRGEMENVVRSSLQRAASPRPIHWVLASIPSIRCVFTTNYDELVEQAVTQPRIVLPYVYDQSLKRQQRPDDFPEELLINSRFNPNAPIPPLVLYKMHGCVNRPGSMLITTFDYVRYLADWKDSHLGMPKEFRNLLVKNTILFLGYGLGDWNFRVIWEAMISSFPGGRFNIQSYAVRQTVTDFERSLFGNRGIELIPCDLTLLARALAEEFHVEIPPPHAPPDGRQVEEGGVA